MNIIPSLQITGGALNAERVRMDVIAQNIANAQTTRDADGKAYQRKVVSFQTVLEGASRSATSGGDDGDASATAAQGMIRGVKVSGITSDNSAGERLYNPTHPDADKDGMVTMPNVKVAQEMVDLITSSRAYEANLTVARNSKTMADAALRIGRP
jgi:flagellar basal-body rod protein FlgC